MIVNEHSNVFRYDINALRALAVLAVTGYHFQLPYFKGGFAGVDIFFVISGFLMTEIIHNSVTSGRFSFAQFYSRRFKRIAPALIALVIAVAVVCFWLYFPKDYQNTQKSALSSLFFVSNFYYLNQSSYFAPSAETNVFLHTWSLSVEWQFYLLYPLILIAGQRFFKDRRRFGWALTIAALALYGVSIVVTKYYRSASFYLLPTRSWEMLAGGVVFFLQNNIKPGKFNRPVAVVGYLTLIGCVVLLNNKMSWPGKFSWLPVVATAVILYTNTSWRLLHFAPLQFFGKISYSLYLWHWPVFVVSQYIGTPLNPSSVAALFMLSTLLAALSYYYIETGRATSVRKILVTAGGVAIVVLVLAVTITNAWLFKPAALKMLSLADKTETDGGKISNNPCFECLIPGTRSYDRKTCMTIDTGKKNVLLIGDSHAAHFSGTFAAFFAGRNVNLLQATATHCLPVTTPNGDQRGYQVIGYAYQDFLLKNRNNIHGIIISAAWYNNSFQDTDKTLSQLKETLNYLKLYNKNVVVLGQSEAYTIPYPTIRAKEIQYNANLRHRYLNKAAETVNSAFRDNLSGSYIDLYDINAGNLISKNGKPYMFDNNHYSRHGADATLEKLMQTAGFKAFIQAL